MQKPIQETQLHDHTCLVFRDRIEFFHCMVPFITNGIKNNERCLIVIDEISRDDVLKNFKFLFRNGVNPFLEMEKGSIVIENFCDVYYQNGEFKSERNLYYYQSQVTKAFTDGYKGLRVFAEISCSLKDKISPLSFLEWEKEADKHFDTTKFLAVCAYNQKYYSNNFLHKMRAAHPIEIDVIKTRF